MKTTLDIADSLLRRAKQLAARRNITLKQVVEEALRQALQAETGRRIPQRLQTHTFGGRGLQPGLSWDVWNALRSFAYEDRAG
jgi:hypothetical protein